MLDRLIGNKQDLALLATRIFIGIIFVAHGAAKFQGGIAGVAGYFGKLGVPAPDFFAWIVALVETFGGIALIVGIFSRIAGVLLSIIMVVAILLVKTKVGLIAGSDISIPGAELDLAILAGTLGIVLQGAGRFSIEGTMVKRW